MSNKAKELDQFYTKSDISLSCLKTLFKEVNHLIEDKVFLEPSAGTGSFIDSLRSIKKDATIEAYDIDPKHPDVLEANFLDLDLENKNYITIGNPPFGTRARLALQFLNKSMEHSDIVAFILPMQFVKWGTQKKVNKDFSLVYNEVLLEEAFIFEESSYGVRSVFQIWVKKDLAKDMKDLRLKQAPPRSHEDFEMWQYNNTEGALKFFDYDWDFAVARQGYKNYKERYYDKSELVKTTQYIFFKAKNKTVLNRLLKLDFEELSKLNTSTPGFGKADVVSLYSSIYDKKKEGE